MCRHWVLLSMGCREYHELLYRHIAAQLSLSARNPGVQTLACSCLSLTQHNVIPIMKQLHGRSNCFRPLITLPCISMSDDVFWTWYIALHASGTAGWLADCTYCTHDHHHTSSCSKKGSNKVWCLRHCVRREVTRFSVYVTVWSTTYSDVLVPIWQATCLKLDVSVDAKVEDEGDRMSHC